jgi:hypothetical protein
MSRLRPWLAVSLILVVAIAALWLASARRRPTSALVEPRLVALEQPFERVSACYYLDGGSVGVEIVDARGRCEQFAIPCHMGSDERYERVFVGALYDDKPGAVQVADSYATKQELAYLLAKYSNGDPYTDLALAMLSGRPDDYLRVLIHRMSGNFND